MRTAALALCLLAGNLFAQPNNSPGPNNGKGAGDTPKAVTTTNDDKPANDAQAADTGPPKWYTPLKRPDWWVVIIAFLTACVIAWQAVEMRRATGAMRSSTDVMEKQAVLMDGQLKEMQGAGTQINQQIEVMRSQLKVIQRQLTFQEAAMKQWLVHDNWRNERRIRDGVALLIITFDIVNPTDWPVTLITSAVRIQDHELTEDHSVTLAPKKTKMVGIAGIPVDDKMYLEGGAGAAYVLFGYVTYLDCFNKPQEWIFGGFVSCHKSGTAFREEWFPENPYRKAQHTDHQEQGKAAEAGAN